MNKPWPFPPAICPSLARIAAVLLVSLLAYPASAWNPAKKVRDWAEDRRKDCQKFIQQAGHKYKETRDNWAHGWVSIRKKAGHEWHDYWDDYGKNSNSPLESNPTNRMGVTVPLVKGSATISIPPAQRLVFVQLRLSNWKKPKNASIRVRQPNARQTTFSDLDYNNEPIDYLSFTMDLLSPWQPADFRPVLDTTSVNGTWKLTIDGNYSAGSLSVTATIDPSLKKPVTQKKTAPSPRATPALPVPGNSHQYREVQTVWPVTQGAGLVDIPEPPFVNEPRIVCVKLFLTNLQASAKQRLLLTQPNGKGFTLALPDTTFTTASGEQSYLLYANTWPLRCARPKLDPAALRGAWRIDLPGATYSSGQLHVTFLNKYPASSVEMTVRDIQTDALYRLRQSFTQTNQTNRWEAQAAIIDDAEKRIALVMRQYTNDAFITRELRAATTPVLRRYDDNFLDMIYFFEQHQAILAIAPDKTTPLDSKPFHEREWRPPQRP